MPESSAAPLAPLDIQLPSDPGNPEATDTPLLRFVSTPDLEVVAAHAHVVGAAHTANLAGGADISGGTALIDLGGLRPMTRINFARSGSPSKLMIQVGGAWFLPAPAGGVASFEDYAPNTAFPELVTEKALLSRVASVSTVESVTFPSNVAVRLTDGGVPFFFQRGPLRPSGADVPDFSQQLSLAIRSAEASDGVCRVELIAHSDTFGTLAVDQADVTFRLVRSLLDGLAVADRTCQVPGVLRLRLPPGLRVPLARPPVSHVTLSLDVRRFGPSFAPALNRHGAVVSPAFHVAQALDVTVAMTVIGLSLAVQRRASGPVSVDIRRDADGEPRGPVLASTTVLVDPLPATTFAALEVPLAPPLAIEAGRRIWVVLRTDQADLEWAADDTPGDGLPALVSLDRGNTWQPHPCTTMYALLLAPGTPSVELSFGESAQPIVMDAAVSPQDLDVASPLLQGLNAALTEGLQPGHPLPETVDLSIVAPSTPGLQVTLARFDATFDQTLSAELSN